MLKSKPKPIKYRDKNGKLKALPKPLYPPTEIREDARQTYLDIVSYLLKAEQLEPVDYISVLLLADYYHMYFEARENIRLNGVSYPTLSTQGQPIIKKNPAVQISQDTAIRIEKMLTEFGCTPKSRNKFKKEKEPTNTPDIPLMKFLPKR